MFISSKTFRNVLIFYRANVENNAGILFSSTINIHSSSKNDYDIIKIQTNVFVAIRDSCRRMLFCVNLKQISIDISFLMVDHIFTEWMLFFGIGLTTSNLFIYLLFTFDVNQLSLTVNSHF